MNILTEITNLLKELAQNPQCPSTSRDLDGFPPSGDTGGGATTLSCNISSITTSLNLTERSSLLDAALSLLCYKMPEVCRLRVKYTVDTLVAVLESSIACKILCESSVGKCNDTARSSNNIQGLLPCTAVSSKESYQLFDHRDPHKDYLQIGTLISSDDCSELFEACLNILPDLDDHVGLNSSLGNAILKVATSASCFKVQFPFSSVVYEKVTSGKVPSVRKIHSFLTSGTLKETPDKKFRKLIWHLDPLCLKEEVSLILKECVKRPFLCLRTELNQREHWSSMMISLATSPFMFMELRTLLHKWLLLTGLNTIMLLRNELTCSLLDILELPSGWGISMDLGLTLPAPHAYFPSKQSQILRILSAPVSSENFLELVQLIELDLHASGNFTSGSLNTVNENSTWAILLDFMVWFYFAVTILFLDELGQDSSMSNHDMFSAANIKHSQIHELRSAASKYLAFVLSPIEPSHMVLMSKLLIESSNSWSKCRMLAKNPLHCRENQSLQFVLERKRKKLKLKDKNEDLFTSMESWLRSFDKNCIDFYRNSGISSSLHYEASEPKSVKESNCNLNLLIRRVPVGIFFGSFKLLSSEECEQLLHYVVTGKILSLQEVNLAKIEHAQRNKMRDTKYFLNEEITGSNEVAMLIQSCLSVFDLFDTLERIYIDLVEFEEGLSFFCTAKGKAGKYFADCIKKLLEREGSLELEMLKDLQDRLLRWMKQGRDIFDGYEKYNELLHMLRCKVSCTSEP